jgi:hypothetical protein
MNCQSSLIATLFSRFLRNIILNYVAIELKGFELILRSS